MYHVGTQSEYAPMLFIVSDQDMECRLEQTDLMIAQLEAYGHKDKVKKLLVHGTHCAYVYKGYDEGKSEFGPMLADYIMEVLDK